MRLVIANKLYSSWSLRPWLVMRAFDIAFEDTVIPLKRPETSAAIREFSPSGKVPVLLDGQVVVWESLAIITYLAERFPEKAIWPREPVARAHAFSVAHEMHGGFMALRRACPMNLGKKFASKSWDSDVLADVARIEALWAEARSRYGSGGPFLFGEFGAVDAMFAPIVCRLDGYGFDVSEKARAYMDRVLSHPAFVSWRKDAFQETWVIAEYEDGHTVKEDLLAG